MGAIVSIYSEVGEQSIVAEGSVVRMGQKIPANVVVGGNPAEVIKEVSEETNSMWDMGKQLYIDLAKKYLKIGMHRLD